MSIFIALEGPDCVGKSTLAKELSARLTENGRKVVHCVCPGSTPFGQEIRRIVKGTPGTDRFAEQIMMAADFIELNAKILSKQEAEFYILDRANFVSGVIYGYAGGLSISQLKVYCDVLHAANLPKMHLLMLTASYDVLKERKKKRSEKCQFEDREEKFQYDVREGYCGIQNNIHDIGNFDIMKPYLYSLSYDFIYNCGKRKSIYDIDARKTPEQVVSDALDFVELISAKDNYNAFY